MPRKEYSFEVRDKAEDLYIYNGRTYDEIAQKIGVSLGTIKNWSKQGGWPEHRKKHLEVRRTLRRSLDDLRLNTTKNAVNNTDPQNIHAVINLEKLATVLEKKSDDKEVQDIDRPKIFLEDLQFVAETLKEIDPEGLKVLSRNFDVIVKRFKAQHAKR